MRSPPCCLRKHQRRDLPLACIVIDFFHWTRQGEWCFDPVDWPDPAGMVTELRSMGIEVMVSIWPTVNPNAKTWEQMEQERWLVETARGLDPSKPYSEDQELDPNITGGDNEVWCWGDQVESILRHCLSTRERLRPYVMRLMADFSATGAPPLRPMFFDFPGDPQAWNVCDQHMVGPDLLVAPVLGFGARSRSVLLPAGCRWTDIWSGDTFEGGQRVKVDATLDRIPVCVREGAAMPAFSD